MLTPSDYLSNSSSIERLSGTETGEGDSYKVTSIGLRFGANIAKDSWDAVQAKWGIYDYGMMLVKRTTLDGYHTAHNEVTTIEDVYNSEHYTNHNDYLMIKSKRSYGDYAAPVYDSETNNYFFTLKLNIGDNSDHTITYCAVPFIVLNDGSYYFLEQMECSVRSLATELYGDDTYPYLSQDALAYLKTH